MSKIVIFGGNGFIGKHLTCRLAENQQDEIIVFDRFSGYRTRQSHPFNSLSNVTIMPGDFSNRDEVSNALTDTDYVFHLISTTTPATSNNDPLVDIDTNIKNSVELFRLCVDKGVKKVVFTSSGGTVYGNINSSQIEESEPPKPLSPYGIGKLTIEHYLRYFKHTHDLDSITYRIANPYGPGQSIYGRQGVIPIFMQSFMANKPITVFGDGSMMRDYIYIDDLVTMIAESYKKDNSREVYNIGSGSGRSVNQLITAIEQCAGHSVQKIHTDTPATFVHKSVLNSDAFVEEFGIIPKVDLAEGMRRTWDYVKEIVR